MTPYGGLGLISQSETHRLALRHQIDRDLSCVTMTAPSTPSPFSPSGSTISTPNEASSALSILQDPKNDEEFAHLMRERTKQRKEREDAALAHLRVQVSNLEAALAAETKRRVQAVADVKAEARAAVESVTAQWKASLQKEGTEANQRLAVLEERIQKLEDRWESDVSTIEKVVATKSTAWKSALDEVQSKAESERKARLQREGRMMQRIQELSDQYEEQWKVERRDRTAAVHALTQRVEIQEGERAAQVKGLQGRIQTALAELESALNEETRERKAQDEELVSVLNRYTAQVQTSLSYVSGA